MIITSVDDPSQILHMVGTSVEATPEGILPAVAQLASSQDPEAAALGLSIFEVVLKQLPGLGAKMVESVEGISILEEQQMRFSIHFVSEFSISQSSPSRLRQKRLTLI